MGRNGAPESQGSEKVTTSMRQLLVILFFATVPPEESQIVQRLYIQRTGIGRGVGALRQNLVRPNENFVPRHLLSSGGRTG